VAVAMPVSGGAPASLHSISFGLLRVS
jgi:hypothetical protein